MKAISALKAAALGLLLAAPAWAGWDWGPLNTGLDLSLGGRAQLNPPLEYEALLPLPYPPWQSALKLPFYPRRPRDPFSGFAATGSAAYFEARLLASLNLGAWQAHLNWLESGLLSRGTSPLGLAAPSAPGRGLWLRRHDSEAEAGDPEWLWQRRGEADLLWLRYERQDLQLTLGRQSVNWATLYYFSAHDFFAPYESLDFARRYKAGVDAARAIFSLAEFAQLEALAVAGYQAKQGEQAWALDPADRKASFMARLQVDKEVLAIGLLAGRQADRDLQGLSLQKDLGGGWMLSSEGLAWRAGDGPVYWEGGLGLSVQALPSLGARLELASRPSAALFSSQLEQRSLAGLGLDWDSGGRLRLGASALADLDRWEGLASLNALWSLADDWDLELAAQDPWRLPKALPASVTPFELAPLALTLRLAWVP